MIDDYGYINARIRAMKGQLLKREFYDELLSQREHRDIMQLLKGSVYHKEISLQEAEGREPLQGIISAVQINLQNTLRKILKISDGEPKRLFETILAKYDVHNLKTLLRGKLQGLRDEEIRPSLLPAGVLDEGRLSVLLQIEEAPEIIDLIATWGLQFSFVISRSLVKMIREKDIPQMEYYIESGYFNWAFNQLRGDENSSLVREILDSIIDSRNIIGCFLFLKEGVKPLGRIKFIEGGKLKKSILRALENAETLKEGLSILEHTEYRNIIRGKEVRDLFSFQRLMEKREVERVVSLKRGDPLGIGVGLSFIWSKESEVVNLRTIAYGIHFNIPRKDIREDLII